MSAGAPEPVGSVAEEAAKLLTALQGWSRERDHHAQPGEHGDDRDQADHPEVSGHDHPPECTWCPVCRVVSVVRGTSPEVRQHLATAAASLVQAAAAMMATDVPGRDRPGGGTAGEPDASDDEREDD